MMSFARPHEIFRGSSTTERGEFYQIYTYLNDENYATAV
jgi:hypothetical protein